MGGLSIPQQGSSSLLNAALYAPDALLWDAPYPLVSMLPSGGADINSVEWAAQRLAADGYMVIITKPQSGGSAASYNTAAKSGIDFLLSVANPFLAEANVSRIGACGWSLGGRSLTLTQAEDTRLSCIVAWDDCEDLRGLVVAGGHPRSFAPSAADPAITSFDARHFACRHLAVAPRNRLFLFLPGTGAVPANYLHVLRCSADHGFHALGLSYVNYPSVAELTSGQPPDTAGNVRLEILDGTDRTPLVDVDRTNSIENRLITALRYLHSLAPGEGWSQYLDAGPTIRWDRILVAGHSQGGGHAAIISRHHPCSRVISFNAIDWSDGEGRPADWMHAPSATPPERVYGVGHLRDPLVPPSLVRQGWNALGIAGLGAEQVPESGSFPFGFTHQFMTDVEPQQVGISTHYHGASVADARTPLDAHALPVLRPFWSHLLLSSGLVPATRLVEGNLIIPTTEDVRYQLETSTDLIIWTAVGSPVAGDGNLLVQPAVPAGTATFWRWVVSW